MENTNNSKPVTIVNFNTIKIGKYFKYDGNVYIKTINCYTKLCKITLKNSVNIMDGTFAYFTDHTPVIKIDHR